MAPRATLPRCGHRLAVPLALIGLALAMPARGEPPPASPGASGTSPGSAVDLKSPQRIETVVTIPVILVSPTRPLNADRSSTRLKTTLQRALDGLTGPARIELAAGHHDLTAAPYSDPSCGNCEDPATVVFASHGLRVSGRGIEIVGGSADSVIIHTNAGYGILFDGCKDCVLRGVTVTGGVRDADAAATDAGVVVRESRVTIERCVIRDNVGDSAAVAATVVGIIGIAGREGSEMRVRENRILRNSWDGIALYRGASAEIRDNVIDGVDLARGDAIGGGRGVGIGVTWDAQADIEGNLVTRYWKGIGVFVDAVARVRENVVEDVATWGIANWDGGRGRPIADIRQNAIFRTGAYGASVDCANTRARNPGAFTGNAVVQTGQNAQFDSGEPYGRQVALLDEGVPRGFDIGGNHFYANREAGDVAGGRDADETTFRRDVRGLVNRLEKRPALRDARFLREFRAR